LPAFQKFGDFFSQNEIRGQKINGDEQNGNPGFNHSLLDFLFPITADTNPIIAPDIDRARTLQNTQMRQQLVFFFLILAIVTDKNCGSWHCPGSYD
jgi:hypothetical protein